MNWHRLVCVALFASFIAAGCFIAIPVGPGGIPIVMQNMFVVLAGLLLGGADGFFATLLFFVSGLIGLPVFSGGRSGLAHILGPTGGFLFGYMLASFVSGCVAKKPSLEKAKEESAKGVAKNFKRMENFQITLGAVLGFAVLYVPGVIHFMLLTKRAFFVTLASCVVPFIPGDIIKCVIAILLAKKLRPVLAQYFSK